MSAPTETFRETRGVVHLAAGEQIAEQISTIALELIGKGFEISTRRIRPGVVRDRVADSDLMSYAIEDLGDLRRADLVLVFPGSDRYVDVELGLALGLGKRVAIVGPRLHRAHWLPAVARYNDWPTLSRRIMIDFAELGRGAYAGSRRGAGPSPVKGKHS